MHGDARSERSERGPRRARARSARSPKATRVAVRVYGETVVVRAVESLDAMSAQYSPLPHALLEKISVRITNELGDHITRVVYDVSHKPPGTIEWE
jgi:GMP synthase PP-ATPase subunit